MAEFVGFSNVMLVGEGGLGRVYRATRDSTGGVVAVKELSDVAEGSAAWHRARRELEAMLLLKGHPYVVSVEEILGGPDGPLLVMEFLSGGSLAERVEAGALTAPEVVLVGQHVSQALAAAHGVGIVHRDVKPHNLLVGGFGQVKVCDFGISALARGDGRTQTKAMTLAYAAPEELDGDELVGPAADVYSLSATLLHLVTGRRPSFRDRMSGVWSTPDEMDPVLGPVMDLIRQGLSHDPDDRPTIEGFVETFNAAARALGNRSIQQLARAAAVLPDDVVVEADEVIADVAVAADATVVRSDAIPAVELLDQDVDDAMTRRRSFTASDGVISMADVGLNGTVGDTEASPDAVDDVGDQCVALPAKSRRKAWIGVGVLLHHRVVGKWQGW